MFPGFFCRLLLLARSGPKMGDLNDAVDRADSSGRSCGRSPGKVESFLDLGVCVADIDPMQIRFSPNSILFMPLSVERTHHKPEDHLPAYVLSFLLIESSKQTRPLCPGLYSRDEIAIVGCEHQLERLGATVAAFAKWCSHQHEQAARHPASAVTSQLNGQTVDRCR